MLKSTNFYFYFPGFCLLVFGLIVCFNLYGEHAYKSKRAVFIKKTGNNFQIIRNGKPFYIKGASGKSYIRELSEAGGNTIRLYDTLQLQEILDEAQKYDIAVIAGIHLPKFRKNNNIYLDSAFLETTKTKIKALVNKHKNHPALLFWNLGNELNYPLPSGPETSGYKFIEAYNELVDLIHQEDPNHPVSTCLAGPPLRRTLSINRNSPQIDLIGYNSFSNIKQVNFNRRGLIYASSLLDIPYFFAEWGIDGPWEAKKNKWMAILESSSTEKGEIYGDTYDSYIKPLDQQCLGSLVFYWGHKLEGTPTWFNIFDETGKKSQAYYSLAQVWSESSSNQVLPPKIEKMTLDGNSIENSVFKSNDVVGSEIFIKDKISQGITYSWEIYENGWEKKEWKLNSKLNESVFLTKDLNTSKVMMKMPEEEGAYRVFVYAYDTQGNFATANMPFYILNQNE